VRERQAKSSHFHGQSQRRRKSGAKKIEDQHEDRKHTATSLAERKKRAQRKALVSGKKKGKISARTAQVDPFRPFYQIPARQHGTDFPSAVKLTFCKHLGESPKPQGKKKE
jgi:hypothetical protein